MNPVNHDYAHALDRDRYAEADARHRIAEARSRAPRRSGGRFLAAASRRAMGTPTPAPGRDPCC